MQDKKYNIKLVKRVLKQIDVFTQLPPGLVEKLASRARIRPYKENDIIIAQFSEADEFYLILDGTVRIYDISKGKPQLLNSLRKGDFFGERSLLFHGRRSAAAQALTDSYLACFDQEAWNLLENEAPAVLAYFREIEKNYELTVTKPPPDSIQYYSCFISYSSKDRDFAKQLYADLQQKDVQCWFAPEDMRIGNEIRPTIDRFIQAHDKLLLILSENSINSDWVEKEVETAFEKEQQQKILVLFPIRLDEAVMETGQAWAADIRRTRHIGDFSRWQDHDAYQQALERLLRDLKTQ